MRSCAQVTEGSFASLRLRAKLVLVAEQSKNNFVCTVSSSVDWGQRE